MCVKQDSCGAQNTKVIIGVCRRKNLCGACELGKAASGGNPQSTKG